MTGEGRITGRKPLPVLLFPPKILQGLTWDWNRVSAARGRRLFTVPLHDHDVSCRYWRILPENYHP